MREISAADLRALRTQQSAVVIAGKPVTLSAMPAASMQPTEPYALQRTTVWSFPDRGTWATHDGAYRGNWSPHVPRNLILRYTAPGQTVLDPMCGGGTTLVEARLTARNAIGVDINPDAAAVTLSRLEPLPQNGATTQRVFVGDASDLSLVDDESVDFVALHPPYGSIIRYSSQAARDLSALAPAKFQLAMAAVAGELLRVVKPGGHCAVLIGDARQHKVIVPISQGVLGAFAAAGFLLQDHAIKVQHNTTSARHGWGGDYDFLLLAHEHLFVFRKPGTGTTPCIVKARP